MNTVLDESTKRIFKIEMALTRRISSLTISSMHLAQPNLSIGGFFWGLGGSDLCIGEMAKSLDGSSKRIGILSKRSTGTSKSRGNFVLVFSHPSIGIGVLISVLAVPSEDKNILRRRLSHTNKSIGVFFWKISPLSHISKIGRCRWRHVL